MISAIFFAPYHIVLTYYLSKYGCEFQKITDKFLGVEVKNLSYGDIFKVSDLKLRLGIFGITANLPNIEGYLKYNKQFRVEFKSAKFDEKIKVKDMDGELNGYIILDFNQMQAKDVKINGKIELKSAPLGIVNLNCEGKERFSCTLDSPNIKGNFTGSLKNGFVTGDFNGTVFGMEKKGERVNMAVGSVIK